MPLKGTWFESREDMLNGTAQLNTAAKNLRSRSVSNNSTFPGRNVDITKGTTFSRTIAEIFRTNTKGTTFSEIIVEIFCTNKCVFPFRNLDIFQLVSSTQWKSTFPFVFMNASFYFTRFLLFNRSASMRVYSSFTDEFAEHSIRFIRWCLSLSPFIISLFSLFVSVCVIFQVCPAPDHLHYSNIAPHRIFR